MHRCITKSLAHNKSSNLPLPLQVLVITFHKMPFSFKTQWFLKKWPKIGYFVAGITKYMSIAALPLHCHWQCHHDTLYVQNKIKVHIITKPRPIFNTPLQHQSKPLYAAGCPVWVCLDGGGRNLICEKWIKYILLET